MSKAEKEAKELVDKFRYDNITYRGTTTTIEVLPIGRAKQCALICVDEMLNNYEDKYKYCKTKQYLEEVKQEIKKL